MLTGASPPAALRDPALPAVVSPNLVFRYTRHDFQQPDLAKLLPPHRAALTKQFPAFAALARSRAPGCARPALARHTRDLTSPPLQPWSDMCGRVLRGRVYNQKHPQTVHVVTVTPTQDETMTITCFVCVCVVQRYTASRRAGVLCGPIWVVSGAARRCFEYTMIAIVLKSKFNCAIVLKSNFGRLCAPARSIARLNSLRRMRLDRTHIISRGLDVLPRDTAQPQRSERNVGVVGVGTRHHALGVRLRGFVRQAGAYGQVARTDCWRARHPREGGRRLQ